MQPFPPAGPPPVFVATARVETSELFTPKTLMKYVGRTVAIITSTYCVLPLWGPDVGPLFTATLTHPIDPPTHPPPLLLSLKPFCVAALRAPVTVPEYVRFDAPARAAPSAAVCCKRRSYRSAPISIANPAKPANTTSANAEVISA